MLPKHGIWPTLVGFLSTNQHWMGALRSSGGSFRKQILFSWTTHKLFYCSISKLPSFLNSRMEMELQTDQHTHITGIYRQYRCQASHSRTFTLLPRPPVISNPDTAPFPTSDCLLQLSLHSWLESQIIASPIRGWVGGGWRCHLSLSLLFPLSLLHVFFPLHFFSFSSSSFARLFSVLGFACGCCSFWLAPFLKNKKPLWPVES